MTLLAPLRVIDFSRVMSGPLGTAFLADLGAEVIKVEAPGSGDDARRFGPHVHDASVYFALLNRNKKSIALDLKQPAARAIALDLIERADVVVENFRPGVATRLGIDYAAAAARNPRVVYLSISGFGATSPMRDWPAYDLIVQAMSGFMSQTGDPDGPPTAAGESIADVWAGLCGSWAVLAALVARGYTGVGRHIDLAMQDAMLAMQLTGLAQLAAFGAAPGRVGNRHPVTTPVDTYRTADGHVALVVVGDAQFATLAKLIGAPDIITDPRFTTNMARRANYAALKPIIEAWTSTQTTDDVAASCRVAGIAGGPLWNLARAASSIPGEPTAHPVFGSLRYFTQPARFSATTPEPTRPDPRLGEHTDAVLRDVLGLAADRIDELRRLGAVG